MKVGKNSSLEKDTYKKRWYRSMLHGHETTLHDIDMQHVIFQNCRMLTLQGHINLVL